MDIHNELARLGILEKKTSEIIDADGGITIGMVRIGPDGGVGLYWESSLFDKASCPALSDEMRAILVSLLRQHADGLESREIDRRATVRPES